MGARDPNRDHGRRPGRLRGGPRRGPARRRTSPSSSATAWAGRASSTTACRRRRSSPPPASASSCAVPTSSACMSTGSASPVDLPLVNNRVKHLALAQSADVRARLERRGHPDHPGDVPLRRADGRRGAHRRGRDRRRHRGAARGRRAGRHRRDAPRARRRPARRRADPHLAPALRPPGAARAPDRGRVGRDGRRVLLGLRRDGQRGHADLQPGPRDAGRGRRRLGGAAGRVRRPRRAHDGPGPGASR